MQKRFSSAAGVCKALGYSRRMDGVIWGFAVIGYVLDRLAWLIGSTAGVLWPVIVLLVGWKAGEAIWGTAPSHRRKAAAIAVGICAVCIAEDVGHYAAVAILHSSLESRF